MPNADPLTHEAFLTLASAAGLDTASTHLEELYTFVQATLAGLKSLGEIDVAGAEPDMAFLPAPE
jgi:hypothetical protein